MKKSLPKVFFILGVPLVAVLILMVSLDRTSAKSIPTTDLQSTDAEVITITLDAPVITPTNTGMCSGWYSYTNELEQNMLLALNYTLTDTQAKLNSGIWRPNLPRAGVYRVEALVPHHPAIDWNCPPDQEFTVSGDTNSARYVVMDRDGEQIITGDQATSNGWLPLGSFVFNAGSEGYVSLNNLTSEESMTRTVSFSAMRFIWQRPPPIYMPLVLKNSGFTVDLENLWSSDPNGNTKYAFLQGESVVYHSSGTNLIGQPAKVKVLWTRDSDNCGSTTIFSGTVSLKTGNWELNQPETLPNCTGLYTQTFQMTYLKTDYTEESQFVINNPSSIVLSDRPAFDRCYAPTVEQMKVWKNKSPYDEFNLYIGGIHFACDDSPLDPVWVHQVSEQGWSFILTWVGPQAPCASDRYTYKISYDTKTAYGQGRSEANAASIAANRLGLMGDKIIYYDLESYSGATTSCRDAVKEFIRGWGEQLHELGYKAGFYGAPCTSYISDWATVDPMPDDVWIAYWTEDSFTETVDLMNVPCLDTDKNNLQWANHQRIRQYTGGHKETYGGVALTIDSNLADAEITTLQQIPAAQPLSSNLVTMSSATTQIQDAQLLPDGQGWALVGGRFLWSENGGFEWQDRTPEAFTKGEVLGSYFLDSKNGWFALRDQDRKQISILRTQDSGKSWQQEVLGAANEDLGQMAAEGFFNFIDSRTGWLAIKLQSSSNFSLGELYGTVDGGLTWKRLKLPIGEAVHFIDARHGWTAGGVSGSELYRTEDGGQTWQAQDIITPDMNIPGQAFISGPVFENEHDGVLVVTYGRSSGSQAAILTTHDGGNSWQLSQNLPLGSKIEAGSALPVSQTMGGEVLLAAPRQGQLLSFSSSSMSSERLDTPSLPEGVVKLSFANPNLGWAQVQNGNCDNPNVGQGKVCRLDSYLMLTEDGGRTWRNVTPK